MRPSVPARHRPRAPLLVLLAVAGCAPRASVPPPPVAYLSIPDAPPPSLRDTMLSIHAQTRARVGLPPLAWSDALAADAQGWADTLARSGGFRHAVQDGEGENLWMGTRGAFRYAEMASYWTGERRNFTDPAHPLQSRTGNWEDVGHYTQIVWRETRRLGCGLASNRRDDVLVCRYDPPGNVEGERAY